jgi:hypothetical protein
MERKVKYNIPSVSASMSWINKYNLYGSSILYQETRGGSINMHLKRSKKLTREEQLLKENEACIYNNSSIFITSDECRVSHKMVISFSRVYISKI